MGALVSIFQLPIVILNFFGFFVSGVWLLAIGQWPAVVAGLVVSFLAHFILGIALLPGLIFAGPAMYMAKKNVTIGVYFFGFLASVYNYVLITAWCGGVTFAFLKMRLPAHSGRF